MTKKSTKLKKPRAAKATSPKSDALARATRVPAAFTKDPRLPAAGTVIQRSYKGKVHEVTVREGGFDYAGGTYRSLSQLAREITGAASINGFLFFGLTGSKKPASAAKPPKGTPEQVASVAKAREARAAKVAARRAEKAGS